MPGMRCAVANCKNNFIGAKKMGLNISFHSFPKNEKIRKLWIEKCGRKHKFNANTSYMCGVHFIREDYEISFRSELTGFPTRKFLIKTAVPSVNVKPIKLEQEQINVTASRRERYQPGKAKKETIELKQSLVPIKSDINRLDDLNVNCLNVENETRNHTESTEETSVLLMVNDANMVIKEEYFENELKREVKEGILSDTESKTLQITSVWIKREETDLKFEDEGDLKRVQSTSRL